MNVAIVKMHATKARAGSLRDSLYSRHLAHPDAGAMHPRIHIHKHIETVRDGSHMLRILA